MSAPVEPARVPQADFEEIAALIAAARQRAVQAVNTTLIDLYWQVGQTISRKIGQAQWGDGVVAQLAGHLAPSRGCAALPPAICQDAAVLRGVPCSARQK